MDDVAGGGRDVRRRLNVLAGDRHDGVHHLVRVEGRTDVAVLDGHARRPQDRLEPGADGDLGALDAEVVPDNRIDDRGAAVVGDVQTAAEAGIVSESAGDLVVGDGAIGDGRLGVPVGRDGAAVASGPVAGQQRVVQARRKRLLQAGAAVVNGAAGGARLVTAEDAVGHFQRRRHGEQGAALAEDGPEIVRRNDKADIRVVRVRNDLHARMPVGGLVTAEGRLVDGPRRFHRVHGAAVVGVAVDESCGLDFELRIVEVQAAAHGGVAVGNRAVDDLRGRVFLEGQCPAVAEIRIVRRRREAVGGRAGREGIRVEFHVRGAVGERAANQFRLAAVSGVQSAAEALDIDAPIRRPSELGQVRTAADAAEAAVDAVVLEHAVAELRRTLELAVDRAAVAAVLPVLAVDAGERRDEVHHRQAVGTVECPLPAVPPNPVRSVGPPSFVGTDAGFHGVRVLPATAPAAVGALCTVATVAAVAALRVAVDEAAIREFRIAGVAAVNGAAVGASGPAAVITRRMARLAVGTETAVAAQDPAAGERAVVHHRRAIEDLNRTARDTDAIFAVIARRGWENLIAVRPAGALDIALIEDAIADRRRAVGNHHVAMIERESFDDRLGAGRTNVNPDVANHRSGGGIQIVRMLAGERDALANSDNPGRRGSSARVHVRRRRAWEGWVVGAGGHENDVAFVGLVDRPLDRPVSRTVRADRPGLIELRDDHAVEPQHDHVLGVLGRIVVRARPPQQAIVLVGRGRHISDRAGIIRGARGRHLSVAALDAGRQSVPRHRRRIGIMVAKVHDTAVQTVVGPRGSDVKPVVGGRALAVIDRRTVAGLSRRRLAQVEAAQRSGREQRIANQVGRVHFRARQPADGAGDAVLQAVVTVRVGVEQAEGDGGLVVQVHGRDRAVVVLLEDRVRDRDVGAPVAVHGAAETLGGVPDERAILDLRRGARRAGDAAAVLVGGVAGKQAVADHVRDEPAKEADGAAGTVDALALVVGQLTVRHEGIGIGEEQGATGIDAGAQIGQSGDRRAQLSICVERAVAGVDDRIDAAGADGPVAVDERVIQGHRAGDRRHGTAVLGRIVDEVAIRQDRVDVIEVHAAAQTVEADIGPVIRKAASREVQLQNRHAGRIAVVIVGVESAAAILGFVAAEHAIRERST